ncbi:hypothetical protein [Saccharopolyspora sp. NPDC002376]
MAATVGETWRVLTDRQALGDIAGQTGRIIARLEAVDALCSRAWDTYGQNLPGSAEESYRAARDAVWGVSGDLNVLRARLRTLGVAR